MNHLPADVYLDLSCRVEELARDYCERNSCPDEQCLEAVLSAAAHYAVRSNQVDAFRRIANKLQSQLDRMVRNIAAAQERPEVAGKTVRPAEKREIAAYASALAQIAEAVERSPAAVTWEVCRRLVEHGLERAGTIVEEVSDTAGESGLGDPRIQIRAWRMRAEELRTTADGFTMPSARVPLRRAAANYERLAGQAEAVLSRRPRKPSDKAG